MTGFQNRRSIMEDLIELQYLLRHWSETERYGKSKYQLAADSALRVIHKVEKSPSLEKKLFKEMY